MNANHKKKISTAMWGGHRPVDYNHQEGEEIRFLEQRIERLEVLLSELLTVIRDIQIAEQAAMDKRMYSSHFEDMFRTLNGLPVDAKLPDGENDE